MKKLKIAVLTTCISISAVPSFACSSHSSCSTTMGFAGSFVGNGEPIEGNIPDQVHDTTGNIRTPKVVQTQCYSVAPCSYGWAGNNPDYIVHADGSADPFIGH